MLQVLWEACPCREICWRCRRKLVLARRLLEALQEACSDREDCWRCCGKPVQMEKTLEVLWEARPARVFWQGGLEGV